MPWGRRREARRVMAVRLISLLVVMLLIPAAAEGQEYKTSLAPPRPVVTVQPLSLPAEIDGRLDEPVWAQAAVLTGFHQYEPVDNRPAAEPTEVRIWYSPEALYIGIIATAGQPNTIRAT